jgi:hypothetical protein
MLLIIVLLASAVLSWWPVYRYFRRKGIAAQQEAATSPFVHSTAGGAPRLFLFHEPKCAGESIALLRSRDLCELTYPSGISAKDNVASVMLAGPNAGAADHDAALAVDVFGTCLLAEQPADPMLIETVTAAGCSDLKLQGLPLQGHVHVRLGAREDAGGGRAEL